MPSTLFTAKSATDDAYSTHVQVIQGTITYLNTSSNPAVLGKLPPGAVVTGGGVQFITAFNDSGTDTVDVGTSADTDEFMTIATASGTAPIYIALDELATNNSYTGTGELTVQAQYNGQNADSTAGEAIVILQYIVRKA